MTLKNSFSSGISSTTGPRVPRVTKATMAGRCTRERPGALDLQEAQVILGRLAPQDNRLWCLGQREALAPLGKHLRHQGRREALAQLVKHRRCLGRRAVLAPLDKRLQYPDRRAILAPLDKRLRCHGRRAVLAPRDKRLRAVLAPRDKLRWYLAPPDLLAVLEQTLSSQARQA